MTGMKSSPYERARSRICFLAARSSSGKGARVWEAMVLVTPAINSRFAVSQEFQPSAAALAHRLQESLRLNPQGLRLRGHLIGRLNHAVQRSAQIDGCELLLRNLNSARP